MCQKVASFPIDKLKIIIIIIERNALPVTNLGKIFTLSRAGVEASLLDVAPELGRKYGVEMHGQEYPMSQATTLHLNKKPSHQ